MEEIWKPIEDIDGYFVSNLGRVKGAEIITKFGRTFKKYPERILKTSITKTGYHYVKFSIRGVKYTRISHRLVASCFVDNPLNKKQVNHIDGNKSNNLYLNLEWNTAAENLKHARDLGLNNSIGTNNALGKFSEEQIKYIRLCEKSITFLSKELKCSMSILSRIRNLKSYKNVI